MGYKHYNALLKKNVTLQLRRVKTNILMLFFVATAFGVLIGMQYTPESNFPVQFYDNNNSRYNTLQCYIGYEDLNCQAWFNIWFSNAQAPSDQAGALPNSTYGHAGMLGNISQYGNAFSSWISDIGYTPSFIEQPANTMQTNLNQLYEYISVETQLMQQQNNNMFHNFTFLNLSFLTFPSAAVTFDYLSLAAGKMNYTIAVGMNPDQVDYFQPVNYNDFEDPAHSVINSLTNGFLRTVSGRNITISTSSRGFSYYTYDPTPDAFVNLALVQLSSLNIIPFILTFVLPLILTVVVSEKHERIRELMRMMGLRSREYWISTYMSGFLMYTVLALFMIICINSVRQVIITPSNPLTYIIMFFLYGNALISFALMLSCFFWRPVPALLWGIVILMCVPTALANVFTAIGISVSMPSVLLLIPPYAIARSWYLLAYADSGPHPAHMADLDRYSPLMETFVFMFMSIFLYLALTWYFDKALPREHGLNQSPLFPLVVLRNKLKGNAKEIERLPLLSPTSNEVPSSPVLNDIRDEAVDQESRKVRSSKESLVKIVDLTKKYPDSDKYALLDVCLAIEEGESLGLLGPNGAGKTTLISLLCGLTKPTRGYATIQNSDIRYHMDRVHELLGFCPQHNILWQDLTVEEHLMFYCALKNHGGDIAYLHVQKLAQEVGLSGEHLHKKVAQLSGGLKRKLAIAIALVGSSRLVLLDEPTAGLDHNSRRAVWDIIERQKQKGRSFIITTHDMSEADALCSRIAIISNGRLQNIGTPSDLKRKFGTGLNLKLTIAEDFWNEQNNRNIAELFPSSSILPTKTSGEHLEFMLSADTKLTDIFSTIQQHKQQYGIIEWSINPTSLEQVFLELVRADETNTS